MSLGALNLGREREIKNSLNFEIQTLNLQIISFKI